jgi:gluconolactonase
MIVGTGALTDMSIGHAARAGADRGCRVVIAQDGCSAMNADWHLASIDYAMRDVATVTTVDETLRALGG